MNDREVSNHNRYKDLAARPLTAGQGTFGSGLCGRSVVSRCQASKLLLAGLTVTIRIARIVPAVITKTAPLKRPISVIFRRIEILTFHKSCSVLAFPIPFCREGRVLEYHQLTGMGIESKYKSERTFGMYTIKTLSSEVVGWHRSINENVISSHIYYLAYNCW